MSIAPPQLIYAPETIRALGEAKSTMFEAGAHIPQQVFKLGFGTFSCVEFQRVFIPEFWEIISGCMAQGNDSEAIFLQGGPEPADMATGCPGARFGRDTKSDEFYRAVSYEDGGIGSSIQIQTIRFVLFGDSGTWGFWGDRDFDVAIAASRRKNWVWPNADALPWFAPQAALDILIRQNLANGVVPDRFAAEYHQNYVAYDRDARLWAQRVAEARREIVSLAAAILDRRMDALQGCRQIAALRFTADLNDDASILSIVGIESETYVLPDDGSRKLYSERYLETVERDVGEYMKAASATIDEICKEIGRKFG